MTNATENYARRTCNFGKKCCSIHNYNSCNNLHLQNYLKIFVVKPRIFFYFHRQLHCVVLKWTQSASFRASAEKRTNKQLTTNNIGGTR